MVSGLFISWCTRALSCQHVLKSMQSRCGVRIVHYLVYSCPLFSTFTNVDPIPLVVVWVIGNRNVASGLFILWCARALSSQHVLKSIQFRCGVRIVYYLVSSCPLFSTCTKVNPIPLVVFVPHPPPSDRRTRRAPSGRCRDARVNGTAMPEMSTLPRYFYNSSKHVSASSINLGSILMFASCVTHRA